MKREAELWTYPQRFQKFFFFLIQEIQNYSIQDLISPGKGVAN